MPFGSLVPACRGRNVRPATSPSFVFDSFTDAGGNMNNGPHVGEVGATWTAQIGSTTNWIFPAARPNSVQPNLGIGNQGLLTASGTPPSANYYVEAPFVKSSTNAIYTAQVGIVARFVNTSLYVKAYYEYSTQKVFMVAVGGTGTTNVAFTPVAGTIYTFRLVCTGNNFEFFIDGVSKLTFTDAALSAAGVVGLWGQYNGGVGYLDSITAQ